MRPVWLLLFVCFTCGCGHTAVVQGWKPAEIDVAGMNRVAVMDFGGPQGQQIATSLAGQLWQNEFYRVVDRAELAGRIQTAGYRPDEPLPAGDVLKLAKSAGIDGVILGDVIDYRCEDQTRQSTVLDLRGDEGDDQPQRRFGGAGLKQKETVTRSGTVTIAFRLVDVKSGEVRASKQVTHQFAGKVVNGQGELPSESEVLSDLTRKCLDDVVNMLAPHATECRIRLAGCDVWTKGRAEVRKGVMLAEGGDWTLAQQKWQQAIELNPDNHAALFNLAVAAAQQQDYCAAEDFAMQSLRIQHKECYARGLESIRQQRTAFEKSREQRDAQLVTTAESLWD